LASESLASGAKDPCTKGQVFHRQYRENEAKNEAKVERRVIYLFSIIYRISMRDVAVLGGKFETENVSCVPSPLGTGRCQMGQVRGVIDLLDRLEHPSK
jgi:hypothetical protein